MGKKSGTNKENLAKTRRIFLREGRKEFVNHGYADASTNRIVDATGMARGSLYYHFEDKKGLFRAVYIDLLKDVEKAVVKAMEGEDNLWEAYKKGLSAYICFCQKKEVRRVIMESYTALGYKERLELQREGILGRMLNVTQQLKQQGYFKNYNLNALDIAIYGMITEAGRALDYVEKPEEFIDTLVTTHMAILDRLAHA